MNLPEKQTVALVAGLVMLCGSHVSAQQNFGLIPQIASAAKQGYVVDGKLDINAAQLSGKNVNKPQVSAATATAAIMAGAILAASDTATVTKEAFLKAAAMAAVASKTSSSAKEGILLVPKMPFSAAETVLKTADTFLIATDSVTMAIKAALAAAGADLATAEKLLIEAVNILPASTTRAPAAVATDTATAGLASSPQIIDTLYPDPLSPTFPHSKVDPANPDYKSAAEILEEFNRDADAIAAKTAEQMGVDYVPVQTPYQAPVQTPEKVSEQISEQVFEKVTGQDSQQVPDSVIEEMPVEPFPVEPFPADVSPVKPSDKDSSDMRPAAGKVASLTWPDAEQDPEFSTIASQTSEELQIPIASQASEGLQTPVDSQVSEILPGSADSPALIDSLSLQASETAPVLFEKAPALDQLLMVKGAPVDQQSQLNQTAKLSGRIVPEKQPLGRRRHLYRWVLLTEDGRRVPLKSNLKLLQEVRREKLLDGNVVLTGRYITSGYNKDLRYYVVESAVSTVASLASATSDLTGQAHPASASSALPVVLPASTEVEDGLQ